ncbi:hypothetical protein [Mesorhizobium amorphae]|uniref:hypothetical protein n=1 Tax=Mesorhizobium amorphae TaxID=71433 RepID=UPI001FF054B8|nr:hypothetical protein [Mesorhizobium amorphae]
MKLVQRDRQGNLNPMPHHRAQIFQPDAELEDENAILRVNVLPPAAFSPVRPAFFNPASPVEI